MQRICLLGATGSIGQSTLDVIARHPSRYQLFAVSAEKNSERLFSICQQFFPRFAVMVNEQAGRELIKLLKQSGLSTEVLIGADALAFIAAHPDTDTVMAAIVGAAGLVPSLAAACAGKKILLANKESLVMAGDLFLQAVRLNGARLLPIDSEHNAIFQCLPAFDRECEPSKQGVEKIILTASGGPFLNRDLASLSKVTPDEACAHPTWSMGRKISVDSATLMNKGLEVIEASLLFSASANEIDVLIHPQSIVHSMVHYIDGSVLAQMGNPDMRTPIAHAMAYPERIQAGVPVLNLAQIANLQFFDVDIERYPCLALAYAALRQGHSAPAVLNAGNEIAVAAFLNDELSFTEIAEVLSELMSNAHMSPLESLDHLLEIDHLTRDTTRHIIARRRGI